MANEHPLKRFIKVAKIRLKSKGVEPKPVEIVKYAEQIDQDEIKEFKKIAKQRGIYLGDMQIRSSAAQFRNPHPVAIAALAHIKETDSDTVEIPLSEAYKKAADLGLEITRAYPDLELLQFLGIGSAEFDRNSGTLRIKVTAPRQHVEELLQYYMSKLRTRDVDEPLLRKAAKIAGTADINRIIRAIHERDELGEKIRSKLPRADYKVIERMLDPRYLTPTHIAVLVAAAKANEPTVAIKRDQMEKIAQVVGKYFSGGKVASKASPKRFKTIAGDVKKTDGHWIFRNVDQEAVQALINHLRKKHKGIDAALREIIGE